jgi:hypothetical protein
MGGLHQLGAFVSEPPSGSASGLTSPATTNALHFVWRVRVLNNCGLPLKLAQLGAAGSTEKSLPVVPRSSGTLTAAANSVPWFWSDASSYSSQQDSQHHEQQQEEQKNQQLLMSVQVAGTDCGWSQVRSACHMYTHTNNDLPFTRHCSPPLFVTVPPPISPGNLARTAREIPPRSVQRRRRIPLHTPRGGAGGDEHIVQLSRYLWECRRY